MCLPLQDGLTLCLHASPKWPTTQPTMCPRMLRIACQTLAEMALTILDLTSRGWARGVLQIFVVEIAPRGSRRIVAIGLDSLAGLPWW
jgi:hypothetical protein